MGEETAGGDCSLPRLPPVHGWTHERRLVERIDVGGPLLDYLQQNGAIDQVHRLQTERETSAVKQNLHLLHCLGAVPGGHALLVNALRFTGQHRLASAMDDGLRPSTVKNSGDAKSRLRGQVNIKIKIKALRLAQDGQAPVDWLKTEDGQYHMVGKKDFISLDNIELSENSKVTEEPKKTEEYRWQISDNLDPVEDVKDEPQKGCFCGCFGRLFKRKSKKEKVKKRKTTRHSNGVIAANMQGKLTVSSSAMNTIPDALTQNGTKSSQMSDSKTELNHNRLLPQKTNANQNVIRTSRTSSCIETAVSRNLGNVVRDRSLAVLEVLSDCGSATYTEIAKYFEQERGILVYDAQTGMDNALFIAICMTGEHLDRLASDCKSGKLASDMENCVIVDELERQAVVDRVELSVELDQSDCEAAEMELSS